MIRSTPSASAAQRTMKKLLLVLVLLLVGCPSNAPQQVDAAPDHRVGSFNPTATGTGIPHVVSGVQSSAASLIVNADVSTSAAIAGTKITPDFGTQSIFTNGGYAAFGSPVAATGTAFRFATNQSAYAKTSGTDRCLWETSDATLYLGNNASNASQFAGISIYAYGTLSLGADASATTYAQFTNGQIVAWKPIVGNGTSSPYSVHGKVTDATVGTFTLTAASYQYDVIMFTGGTAGTITFPTVSDAGAYYKTIINTSGVTKTLSDGGATTVVFNTGNIARFLFDAAGVHLASASTAWL